MRIIKGRLFRIHSSVSMRWEFVECENERELIEYMAKKWLGDPASVVEILKDGRTPKVAIYTNPLYKELTLDIRRRRK